MLLSRLVYCALNVVVWFVCVVLCFLLYWFRVIFRVVFVLCFVLYILLLFGLGMFFSICVANSSFCFIVVVVGVIIDSYMLVYHFVSSVFVFCFKQWHRTLVFPPTLQAPITQHVALPLLWYIVLYCGCY